MDHTVLRANYTMPAFLRKCSADGGTPDWGSRRPIAAHLSTPKGCKAELTYSGQFTHISGNPSATGRAQDREVRWPKTDALPQPIYTVYQKTSHL